MVRARVAFHFLSQGVDNKDVLSLIAANGMYACRSAPIIRKIAMSAVALFTATGVLETASPVVFAISQRSPFSVPFPCLFLDVLEA